MSTLYRFVILSETESKNGVQAARQGEFEGECRAARTNRGRCGAEQKNCLSFFDFARADFFLLEGKAIFCEADRRFAAAAGGQRRFRFLDLWIKFGKIISKVCEGFNSGAKKLDTNSFFEDESVRSPTDCSKTEDSAKNVIPAKAESSI